MLVTSNAYTLKVRQGPEKGKAFAGPKEKGEPVRRRENEDGDIDRSSERKPVDPPPIIQLIIKDPTDPAS